MNKKLKQLSLLALAGIVFACGQNNQSDFTFDESKNTTETMDSLINKLPSYQELVIPLRESDSKFQPELISEEDLPLPDDQSYAALQTGIFMSDMAYCRYFEQVNKTRFYSGLLKKRMQAYDMPQKDISELALSLEKNIHNHDSLVTIISDTYDNINTKMIETNRQGTAVLVMTGVWIESNRLMLSDTSANQKIISKEWEKQQQLGKKLLGLIDGFDRGIPDYLTGSMEQLIENNNTDAAREDLETLHQKILNKRN